MQVNGVEWWRLLLGLAGQLAVVVGLGWSSWRLATRVLHDSSDEVDTLWDRVIAAALFYLSAAVLVPLALGSVGLLQPLPLFVLYMLVIGVGHVVGRPSRQPWLSVRVPRSLSALAIATAVIMLPFGVRAVLHVPVAWDELSYHLLKPALWLNDGELSRSTFPFPLSWLAYYPANGELVWCSLMGVLRNDLLVHVLNLPLTGVLGVIAMQLTVQAGGSRGGGWSLACIVMTLPVVLGYSATSYVECILNVSILAAVHFALRWVRSDDAGAVRYAILTGLGSGLAVGTKYSALPVVAVLVFVVSSVLVLRRRRIGRVLLELTPAGAALLTTGAAWYLRNAIETGNPFYPVPMLDLPHADDPDLPWKGQSIMTNFREVVSSGHLTAALFGVRPVAGYIGGAGLGALGVVLVPLAIAGSIALWATSMRSWIRQTALLWYRKRRKTADAAASPQDLGGGEESISADVRSSTVHPGATGTPPAARPDGSTAVILGVISITTLFTYVSLPYWGKLSWIASQVRFITPFVVVGCAAGVPLVERFFRGRIAIALVSVAISVNALQLRLQFPSFGPTSSLLVVVAILAPLLFLLARDQLRVPRHSRVIAVGCMVLFGPLLVWRESRRFEQFETLVEVHHSEHRPLVAAAARVAERYPAEKVAIAMPSYEFLYLFTGHWLNIRPIYIVPHSGPGAAFHYPDGDPRHGSNPEIWRLNRQASGAAALVVARWSRDQPWPAEKAWAEADGLSGESLGDAVIYDLTGRRPPAQVKE